MANNSPNFANNCTHEKVCKKPTQPLNNPSAAPFWCFWALSLLAAGPQGSKILPNTRKSFEKSSPVPKWISPGLGDSPRAALGRSWVPFTACSRSAGVKNLNKYARNPRKSDPISKKGPGKCPGAPLVSSVAPYSMGHPFGPPEGFRSLLASLNFWHFFRFFFFFSSLCQVPYPLPLCSSTCIIAQVLHLRSLSKNKRARSPLTRSACHIAD